jgi:hypothetical protein
MTTEPRIDGTWNVVLSTPQGDRTATLRLEQVGATVTGTMNGTAIQDGAWQAGRLTFSAQLTQPAKITLRCSASVDSDAMTGTAKAGRLPMSAPFSGRRVAA